MKQEQREQFVATYGGMDRSTPIRCNRQVLKPTKNKRFAHVLAFGDLHYGSPQCMIKKALANLQYCYDNRIYVLYHGDLIDAGTRHSIGTAVYDQVNPTEQVKTIIDISRPLVDRGLLLGYISGNHEHRITKETGIDITSLICHTLGIPYLGSASWNHFTVNNQTYSWYAMHGASGSKYLHTKLSAAIKISHNFACDIFSMGHVHDLHGVPVLTQAHHRGRVVEREKWVILTGAYLRYDSSYGQDKGFDISKVGSPKVHLCAHRHDIHVSY